MSKATMAKYVEATVQQGGGGFMKHAVRTPLPDSVSGHFYGRTLCDRKWRPLWTGPGAPREFEATTPDPKPTWDGGRMNRYCPRCIALAEPDDREEADRG